MIISNNCTGCGACTAICPQKCITMVQNKIGELVPCIDKKFCAHCNQCLTQCPQNNPCEAKMPFQCYVAWSKNHNDLKYSASGGVGTVFMRRQTQYGGVAYGCDYDKNCNLEHFEIKNVDDIFRVQSSKYSQSSSYVCFNQVRDKLEAGKSVLFIGTPCQIAGLKRFLHRDYKKLITVDLICHGTPPNTYLKEHVKTTTSLPISKLRFRGEYDQYFTVWKNNSIVYQKNRKEDLYFWAFYENMISRNSCYNCQYAKSSRISDITIGDFWGLHELKTIKALSERPSLILINSKKGELFFEKVTEDLVFEQREVQEGISGNGRLNAPPGKKEKARIFQIYYPIMKFDTAVFLACKTEKFISRIRQYRVGLLNVLKGVKNKFCNK